MFRPRLRIPRVGSLLRRPATPFRRGIHYVPPLEHIDPEQGVPGLLTPDGFDFAWTQYMNLMIQKLNTMVAGTDYEQQDTLTIIKSSAREPSQAAVFNYASMAHNNHLFFQGLKGAITFEEQAAQGVNADEPYEEKIPMKLRKLLESNFSSIETLRREFTATAMGMFGPGFVWLVKNAQTSNYRILATYLAGTPYTAGHWRRQPVDMNSHGASGPTISDWLDRTATGAGADNGSMFQSEAPGGTDVVPLLCLNTWEHVWLRDYGIHVSGIEGKKIFVESWWECINWDRVERLANIQAMDTFRL
ncbi:Manganese/iron superoxide dismutase [Biscogniauxia mediterranea]|nr:Manganese/iron superoxide dismutase [Biscogniauxia mediterranea]